MIEMDEKYKKSIAGMRETITKITATLDELESVDKGPATYEGENKAINLFIRGG